MNNNYTRRVTMDFGEKVCPNPGYHDKESGEIDCTNGKCEYYSEAFEQNCCFDREYCALRKTKVIPLTVTFDLWETCPECGGSGITEYMTVKDVDGDPTEVYEHESCEVCSDNVLPPGKIHRYYTPEEAARMIKEKTGIDWVIDRNQSIWMPGYKGQFVECEYRDTLGENNKIVFVRFPLANQPAPSPDYRPKEMM